MTEDPILAAFAARLGRRPDHPLVTSRLHTATVADVDAVAGAVSRRLEAVALEPGALLALASPNGPGFLAALLALRRAGCVALLVDWRTPEGEKGRAARQLGAAAELRVGRAWPGPHVVGTTQVSRWTYESYSATRVLVFDGDKLVSIQWRRAVRAR